MDRTEKIRAAALSGTSACDIAAELGITRQRVYQIAKLAGIKFKLGERNNKIKIVPRIVINGDFAEINQVTAGTIGELLVAADLFRRGWMVYRSVIPNRGHDIIATMGTKIITVEVRSARRVESGRIVFNKRSDDLSQFYALVVTGEPVIYQPDLDT